MPWPWVVFPVATWIEGFTARIRAVTTDEVKDLHRESRDLKEVVEE